MATTDDRLAELLVQWEEAWEKGEELLASQLCEMFPELTEPLQKQIDGLKRMSWMTHESEEAEHNLSEQDSLVGQTLADRYVIEARIGEGGFGRVYRAFDNQLQRHVAIKTGRTDRAKSSDQADQLLQEARRAAKLRHSGIVTVHDVGCHDGAIFFVSELIEGHNLAELIATKCPSPTIASRIVAEIAESLQFAHEQGFIHRDIKPANILLDQQGRALITDFGIAATVDQIDQGDGVSSGTLAYMAPEQIAGQIHLLGPRTDLYALGVIMYELLTGAHPFPAGTPTALREQILLRQPKSPRTINSCIPQHIEAVCLRCLAKHPSDRFECAAELANALRTLPSENTSGRFRSRLQTAAVLVVVFASGFGVSSWLWQSQTGGSAELPEKGVFVFDGTKRIVTPLERFAPATLEAWVWPQFYPRQDCQFCIGSDVPTKHGIGMGMCEAILSAEIISGPLVHSDAAIPLNRWTHIAVVFGANETRLYLNGKNVGTGPASQNVGETTFVVGNVGRGNPINFFVGKMRSIRISNGERFQDNFVPNEKFVADLDSALLRSVLIYDGSAVQGNRVIDLSGAGNDGQWEK